MKLCFVLFAAALLAWCAVDARPQPGTTKKEDLDGIGDDLEDFLKHKDQNNHRLSETQNVYNTNRNTLFRPKGAASAVQPHATALLGALKKPTSGGSDILGDLLNSFRGGQGGSTGLGGLGSLGGFGGLNTRPSNPPSSVQYPSRPASSSSGSQYPARPASPSSGSRYPALPADPAPSRPASSQYPSRPASNVPSYPSYPSSGSGAPAPMGGGWVVPGGNTATAPKASYPSYPSSNYPSYPSYTNYQRGNPNPYSGYPGYQQPAYQQPAYRQPAYQQPAYQQPANYPGYQQTYAGPQSVQRYDPRNPPPAPTKSTGSGISKFFKKIFS